MKRRQCLTWTAIIGTMMAWIAVGHAEAMRPNLVFILVDDLGTGTWAVTATRCTGHAHRPACRAGGTVHGVLRLFFGSGDARAVRRGKWKYLLTGDPSWKHDFSKAPMLFNLHDDPGETTNLVTRFPAVAEEWHEAIQRFQQQADREQESRR